MDTNGFSALSHAEIDSAHATVDKLAAGCPESFRTAIKCTVGKLNGVIVAAVTRPASSSRGPDPVTEINPWVRPETFHLPLVDAVAEILSANGGPSELGRRRLTIFVENHAELLRQEQHAKQEAAEQVAYSAEQKARQAAWAAMSATERAAAQRSIEDARKHRDVGAPPPGWTP